MSVDLPPADRETRLDGTADDQTTQPMRSSAVAAERVDRTASEQRSAARASAAHPLSLADETEDVARYLAVRRLETAIVVVTPFAVLGLLLLWHLPPSRLRSVSLISLGLVLGSIPIHLYLNRKVIRDRQGSRVLSGVFGLLALSATSTLIPTIGTFGNLGSFLALALLLAAATSAWWALLATAVVMIGAHAAFGAAILGGWFTPNAGVEYDGSPGALVYRLVVLLLTYGTVIVLGRVFLGRSQQAVREIQRRFYQIAAREALLRDARAMLDRAAGVGQPGRLSGQRLGRFALGPILGRGGMSEIYEAESEDGSPAAVKVIRRQSGPGDAVERFAREATVLEQLQSAHIVRVLEVGGADAPVPYLAMERLVGCDLALLLRRKMRLSPKEVLEMVRQIGGALQAAHDQGIVHRDIKPQNLFLHEPRTWKLLDFGIARTRRSLDAGADAVEGTPMYMAPEQLSTGAPEGAAVDQHALATVVYRALVGRPAYAASDRVVMAHRVTSRLPVRPSSAKGVDSAVDDVLRIAMAKQAADRFGSVQQFVTALERAIAGDRDPQIAQQAALLNRQLPWEES